MATPVIMPRQGITVESCVIGEWHKKVGDPVKTGEPLFSYETDKSAFEEEAKADGILLAIFCEADEEAPVLSNVAVIGEAGEDPSPFAPEGAANAAPAPVAEPVPAACAPAASAAAKGAALASPKAKKYAEHLGVDYTQATGTGPNGMIVEADIRRLAGNATAAVGAAQAASGTGIGGRVTTADLNTAAPAPAPAPAPASQAEYDIIKHSKIRLAIAKNMHHSLQSMAQITNDMPFDGTEVLAYREKLKAHGEALGLPPITINDMCIFALSRVLRDFPDMNAYFFDDHLQRFHHVHMGIAVDTPRGLMVPTLKYADQKSLVEIARESKELIQMAISGNISPDLLQGATITITNAGKIGIESSTPIINPPQVAIFGVGAMMERVRRVNGQIDVYTAIATGFTYDHRAIDGAPAGYFQRAVCKALENFSLTLAKG